MNRDDRAEHADQPRDVQAPGARRKGRPSRGTKREMPAPLAGGAVTALRALDPRGARFEVEIGGQRRVVSSELIGDFRLSVGRVIDASSAGMLSEGIRRLAVFDRAVAILARRPRSARDLRLRLLRAGASDADAAAALDRLQALGLQDDAAFARHLAETRAAAGGVSKRRLQQELRRQGVAPEASSAAVDAALGDVGLDEQDAALAAAHKRMRALRGLDPAVARRRLYAFLARRGYDSGVIARVTRAVLDAREDDVLD